MTNGEQMFLGHQNGSFLLDTWALGRREGSLIGLGGQTGWPWWPARGMRGREGPGRPASPV